MLVFIINLEIFRSKIFLGARIILKMCKYPDLWLAIMDYHIISRSVMVVKMISVLELWSGWYPRNGSDGQNN